MTRIITLSTNKGGVLKTSLTSNLAGVLSKQGKKILLVDVDNQGNLASNFGLDPDDFEKTIFDVLINKENINNVIVNVAENIDLLPANVEMSNFELQLFNNLEKYPEPYHLLKNALNDLNEAYDFIFIDTPPNTGMAVGNVLVAAQDVVIPLHPEFFSVNAMVKIIQAVGNFKEFNPELNVLSVVPTKVKKNSSVHNINMQSCKEFCKSQGIGFTKTKIHESVSTPNALQRYQLPIVLTNSKAKTVAEYEVLVKELGL